MVCTFFGHRHTSPTVREPLIDVLTDLIENRNTDIFYVGHQGEFDSIVRTTLDDLKKIYPHIKYYVVLAYMPGQNSDFGIDVACDTIYPEGLGLVPPRFAILRRNEWMVKNSDIVVAYVVCSAGGAAKAVEYAERKKREVINLAR